MPTGQSTFVEGVASRLKDSILGMPWAYDLYLRVRQSARPTRQLPSERAPTATLQTRREAEEAVEEVTRLGLPLRGDRPKNWDALGPLTWILRHVPRNGRVLDAGGDLNSVMLPWLYLYGYENLFAIDPVFERQMRRGPILYRPGDVTATSFEDGSFDAITCLSVIEHGVDLEEYLRETARILKPGGYLITSCDYWQTPVQTEGLEAFGSPVHVFTPAEISELVEASRGHGFELEGSLDLECTERVVHWTGFGVDYTFLRFTLRRTHIA